MHWDPMWGILILADFTPMGRSVHTVIVFGLGKDLLFKFVLGHCEHMGEYHHKPTIEVSFFMQGLGEYMLLCIMYIYVCMNEWILHNV